MCGYCQESTTINRIASFGGNVIGTVGGAAMTLCLAIAAIAIAILSYNGFSIGIIFLGAVIPLAFAASAALVTITAIGAFAVTLTTIRYFMH